MRSYSIYICLDCFTKHNACLFYPRHCSGWDFPLLKTESYSLVHMCIFFTTSSIAEHLNWFCTLAVVIITKYNHIFVSFVQTLNCLYLQPKFAHLPFACSLRLDWSTPMCSVPPPFPVPRPEKLKHLHPAHQARYCSENPVTQKGEASWKMCSCYLPSSYLILISLDLCTGEPRLFLFSLVTVIQEMFHCCCVLLPQ